MKQIKEFFIKLFKIKPPVHKPLLQIIDSCEWSFTLKTIKITVTPTDPNPKELWQIVELVLFIDNHKNPAKLNVANYIQKKGLSKHFKIETVG